MVNIPQRSFTSGELSPDLHARSDLAKYATGAALLENVLILPYGGVCNRPGYQYCGDGFTSDYSLLVDFIASTDDTYCLEFSHLAMRVWRNGALVRYPTGHPSAGQIVVITTPYPLTSPNHLFNADRTAMLKWEQSNDVMTLYHPLYFTRTLSRFDHHDWTIVTLSFMPTIQPPTGMNVVATQGHPGAPETNGDAVKTHRYGVSAIAAIDGEESTLGDIDSVENLLGFDQNFNTLTWNTRPGAEKYAVYKESNSVYGLVGYTTALTFKDDNIAPDFSKGPRQGKNPFGQTPGDFPTVGCFFEQRQGYFATLDEPSLMIFSRSSDFNNVDESEPLRDDDGIEFRIAARSTQRILWAVAMSDLLVFTTSTEWKVGGAGGDVLTPSSIVAKPQSYYGAHNVRPVTIGTDVLWVQRGGRVVRSTAFSFESDRYVAVDRTVMAAHLFEGKTIIDWAFCQNPFYNIHTVTADYSLRCLTFMPEHDVWGWSRESTDGRIGSMCAIPEGNEDIQYISVKRWRNGGWRHFIERSRPRNFADPADGFFVDSGLTLDIPVAITAVTVGTQTFITSPAHGRVAGQEIDLRGLRLWRETEDGGEEWLIEGHHLTGFDTDIDTIELNTLDQGNIDTTGWTVLDKGIWRDCVNELDGMDHLNNREVVAVGDGVVLRPCVVTDGVVIYNGSDILPWTAGRWHVGLPYKSRVQTLEMEQGQTSAMANNKAITGARLFLHDARGLWVGPDWDSLQELPSREFEEVQMPPRMQGEPVDVEFGANWNKVARVCIEQRDPVPFTLTAIVPGLEYGGSR